MPPAPDDRRPAITPQLALRVAVLGGIAFALFAIVFFRLWFLQVLSGDEYVSQARENRVRKVKVEAPRGDIVDRHDNKLVETKEAAVVQLDPTKLPGVEREVSAQYLKASSALYRAQLAAGRRFDALDRRERRKGERTTKAESRELARLQKSADTSRTPPVPALPREAREARRLYARLGRVIGVSPQLIHKRVVQQLAQTPYAAVTIKTDITPAARNYLLERAGSFPGVMASKTYLRSYPQKTVGAQLFGTLAEISGKQLGQRKYRGVAPGTRIGRGGIEETYDRYLRGVNGFSVITTDAQGRPRDELPSTRREPQQGNRVKLTLDVDLQRAADKAMQRSIGIARLKQPTARAGAYVAMNPETGEIYALGSYPSYDANLFAKPISQETFARLNSQANGAPLFNRALSATYPTGSVFKPVTALAGLETGTISPGGIYNDTGTFKLGNQSRQNAKAEVYGPVNLSEAIKVSVDTYFFDLGLRLNDLKGRPLQTWARKLGFEHRTGIDLPGEPRGLVPDATWRNRGFAKYERCRKKAGLQYQSTAALFACGGIDRTWTAGDNVSLAVGQGDLQASPLQVAVAYSALANGGRIVRPRLGQRVEDGQGALVQELDRPARRRVKIDEGDRRVIMDGLRRAASEPKGTSAAVFKGFGGAVYGKTGTVERAPNPDQSYYAAYVNQQNRPIVVVTTIEKGGFGAETAAPAACRILAQWYGKKAPCGSGTAAQ